MLLHVFLPTAMATLLICAVLKDIAARTIPDFVPIGLLALGITSRLASHDATAALAASSIVFVLGILCWRLGWLGGGDVKLSAACAWLMPPTLVPQFVLLTALAGGVLAGLYLAIGRLARRSRPRVAAASPRSLAGRVLRIERWRISRRGSLPYGCAIAVGTLFTMSSG